MFNLISQSHSISILSAKWECFFVYAQKCSSIVMNCIVYIDINLSYPVAMMEIFTISDVCNITKKRRQSHWKNVNKTKLLYFLEYLWWRDESIKDEFMKLFYRFTISTSNISFLPLIATHNILSQKKRVPSFLWLWTQVKMPKIPMWKVSKFHNITAQYYSIKKATNTVNNKG